MQLLYGFMAWKSATGFVMSSELIEPDAVISAAVDRKNILSACRPIVRRPLTVGPIEWLRSNLLAKRLLTLAARKGGARSATEIALVRAFGHGGEFESAAELGVQDAAAG